MHPLVAATVLVLATMPSIAVAGEEVVIVVGKSQTLTVPFALGEGANSNPSVVRAAVDPPKRSITFFGIATGSTTYTVIDARMHSHMITYEIRVVPVDLGAAQGEIQRELDDLEGGRDVPWWHEPSPDAAAKEETPPTPQAAAAADRLRRRLRDIEGVDIVVDGNTVRLEGDVATEQDLDTVNRAVADEQSRD